MAKKKSVQKMPICNVKLSTGYTIPIDLSDIDKDIGHLCNAFIGEIFMPNLDKLGTKKAVALLQDEIVSVCDKLNNKNKTSLLSVLLWRLVLERYDEIEKKTRKSKVKSKKK